MILAFSTSSPRISLALFSEGGALLAACAFDGEGAVNRTMLELRELLDGQGAKLDAVLGFVADVGPGSFAGVKAGVTFAKVFGQALDRPVAGVSSFALIDDDRPVAIPCRRGEYFLRCPGREVEITRELPSDAVGYGAAFGVPEFPHAARACEAGIAEALPERRPPWVEPAHLVPEYRLEPSITPPKKPFAVEGR